MKKKIPYQKVYVFCNKLWFWELEKYFQYGMWDWNSRRMEQ